MSLKAVIFGAIGTLVETSELQRQAFNTAFANAKLDWSWDVDLYQELLKTSGGQNRIRAYAERTGTHLDEAQVRALHADKSAIFQQMLQSDGINLRDGVAELVQAATAENVAVAFASTTSQENINAIDAALGEASPFPKFAVSTHAETVSNKKPAPDVYVYVLNQLGIKTATAIAIEDTAESLSSAQTAGLTCVATPGAYAEDQDFSVAAAVAAPGQIGDLAWLRSLVD